jgi:hypothetical protein
MRLKINELTEEGYECCKKYIGNFDKVSRRWGPREDDLLLEVDQGRHDNDFFHFPDEPTEMKSWYFLIIAERYIKHYEKQGIIVCPLRYRSNLEQGGNSASQSKTGGKFQSVNIAGDGPVSSKGQVSGSGLCVETRSSHITCRRRSKKHPTARRLHHRSSNARKSRKSRKSRATRRR